MLRFQSRFTNTCPYLSLRFNGYGYEHSEVALQKGSQRRNFWPRSPESDSQTVLVKENTGYISAITAAETVTW